MITSSKIWFFLLPLFVYLLEFDIIPHTQFSFKCKDPKLTRVFKGDTVTPRNLLLSATLGPLLIITLVEALKENSFRKLRYRNIWRLHRKCLLGSMTAIFLTQIIKSIIKEARPHFLSSCRPDSNEICEEGSLVFEYNCTTQLDYVEKIELIRSFPSGHASVSVFIAVYCTYLIMQVNVSSKPKAILAQSMLIIVCLSWCCLCSVSRITDGMHHWWDVLAGAFLGVVCAICAFFVSGKEIAIFMTDSKMSFKNNQSVKKLSVS